MASVLMLSLRTNCDSDVERFRFRLFVCKVYVAVPKLPKPNSKACRIPGVFGKRQVTSVLFDVLSCIVFFKISALCSVPLQTEDEASQPLG